MQTQHLRWSWRILGDHSWEWEALWATVSRRDSHKAVQGLSSIRFFHAQSIDTYIYCLLYIYTYTLFFLLWYDICCLISYRLLLSPIMIYIYISLSLSLSLISFRRKVSPSSSLLDHSPALTLLSSVKMLKSSWPKTWDLPLRANMGRLDNNVRQLNSTMLQSFFDSELLLAPARPKTGLRNLWSPCCRSLERSEAWWKSLRQSMMAMTEPNSFSLSPLQSTHHWQWQVHAPNDPLA